MKSIVALFSTFVLSATAQASDRDCTCRGETAEGKAITVVYNGRDGLNNMAEAHVQIKVKGTAQKYFKSLPVYLEPSAIGQRYAVKNTDFKLVLVVPPTLNLGDQFVAEYSYNNRFGVLAQVELSCKATQNR